MWSMIGYFRVESKSVGLYIIPSSSVIPSRAFTRKGSGCLQRISRRREMSASSSRRRMRPSAARSTVTGGWFTRE